MKKRTEGQRDRLTGEQTEGMTDRSYHVIGLMSGTSLDGLDIAYCRFSKIKDQWEYQILEAETIPYSDPWRMRLGNLENSTALEFAFADTEFGHLLGQLTQSFITRHSIHPVFIASHGHTIFHQPDKKLTTQIGKGSAIAFETGLPVICDFRSLDVAHGGQGAPLVPIGDKHLFAGYDFCLNLGGFANISFDKGNQRIAFDICPVNMVLNHLTTQLGLLFDEGGYLASTGCIDTMLLDSLNQIPYYHRQPPKSLGKEWVVSSILPLLNHSGLSVPDLLCTFCEHVAIQTGYNTGQQWIKKLLITGGGARNTFLLERLRAHVIPQIIMPDPLTIDFKEALIFAFLGLLRWRNEVNCLKSVTGATSNVSGGSICGGTLI